MQQSDSGASAIPNGGFKSNNLVQAWLVLLLALCFGGALAAVQISLSGTIAANKLNETLGRVPELVWGAKARNIMSAADSSVDISADALTVNRPEGAAVYPLYRIRNHNRLAGWVVKSSGQGYAGKIELLVGFDPGVEKITGLFILDQKETPGLGNKITFAGWRGQFLDKPTQPALEIVKGKGQQSGTQGIDAVTGATISSRAVTDIVNRIISDVKARLTTDVDPALEGQQ